MAKTIVVEERITHCPYCDNLLLLKINAVKMPKEMLTFRRSLAKKLNKELDLD